jgi:hypothetical protein
MPTSPTKMPRRVRRSPRRARDIFAGRTCLSVYWITQPTTVDVPDSPERLTVTHPFHPRSGEELRVLAVRRTAGESRVDCCDDAGAVFSLVVTWTSLAEVDPFARASAGRAPFRVEELLHAVALVAAQRESAPGLGGSRVGKEAEDV